MAKPTTTYPWATGASATLEPDAGSKVSGFVANDKPPARWHNWLFNGAYRWQQYLSNLHNESEFLNKAYVWAGAHGFSSTLRMRGSSNEIEYADAAGTPTPRARTLMIPMTAFIGSSQWTFNPISTSGAVAWSCTATGTPYLSASVFLPSGALVTKVRYSVAVTANFSAWWGVLSSFPGGTEAADNNSYLLSEYKTVNVAGTYDCMPAAGNVPILSGGSQFYFAMSGATAVHAFRWAQIHFTDPGPRNF